ncbi:MAG: HlyD family efflux transporter periplasmic adaptor subunit [Bacillota bacterium]|jgi:multidrug resistance efflux pump
MSKPQKGTETMQQTMTEENVSISETAANIADARKKSKKHKKLLIILLIVAVIAVIIGVLSRSQSGNQVAFSDTTVLALSDMQDTVSATGTVASANYNIYTNLTYPVQEILVTNGEVVQEGDVLCLLDTEMLERQIAVKETAAGISAETAALQVQAAKNRYNDADRALQTGTNATLIGAQGAVDQAKDAWKNAQRNYNDYVKSLKKGENPQILSQQALLNNATNALTTTQYAVSQAQKGLTAAENNVTVTKNKMTDAKQVADLAVAALPALEAAYQNANQQYNAAKLAVDIAGEAATAAQLTALSNAETLKEKASNDLSRGKTASTDASQKYSATTTAYYEAEQQVLVLEDTLAQAKLSLKNAQDTYKNTYAQYKAALSTSDSTLIAYAETLQSAYKAYLQAQNSQKAGQNAAQTELDSYYNAWKSSEVAAKDDLTVLELAALYEDLQNCTIKAPTGGIITAVYAEVGTAMPTGSLFIIEDPDSLKIETSVKEFDVGNIKPGMAVMIKSDATGDKVYDGKVVSVAPSAIKSELGENISSNDVQFAVEVAVTDADDSLKIGMNVRINYVLEEQQNILKVPYDAVYTNEAGQTCILALLEQTKDNYLLSEYVVTTGLENDLDVMIEGTKIVKGLRVLNSPGDWVAGDTVKLVEKLPAVTQTNVFTGESDN